MGTSILEKKIAQLPENLRLKAEGIIDDLLIEAKKLSQSSPVTKPIGNRGYGSLKDKIWMSADFNDPLEDFKDYM